MSSMHLLHCHLYEERMVAKTFSFTILEKRMGRIIFVTNQFEKLLWLDYAFSTLRLV